MVERVAPVVERRRAQQANAAAAKAKRARVAAAKARAKAKAAETARYTVEGTDLRRECKRLLKLNTFGGRGGRLVKVPPRFEVTYRATAPRRVGSADAGENRIWLANYPALDLADARETLVHELTHLVVDQWYPGAKPHGPEFKRLMTAAFKEAYKVLPVGLEPAASGGGHARALKRKEAR